MNGTKENIIDTASEKLLAPTKREMYDSRKRYVIQICPFSNPSALDTFRLALTGKSIIDGSINFLINSYQKQLIHNETFPASDLLGDLEGVLLSTSQKEDIIIQRMQNFFSKDHFIFPAIKIAKPFYADNSNEIIWKEINADKTAIGFIYTHGYEGTYAIAYSKKRRFSVLYYYSD